MRWDSSPLFFEIILRNCLYICIVIKTEKDSIMETTAYTSDNIITRSYEEYHQVILNYITYRIAHRYEAEDLTQDVFVRLMDYKQMLRPDTVSVTICWRWSGCVWLLCPNNVGWYTRWTALKAKLRPK